MGVASGCGEQEVGVASGSGWNLWVWLLGVVIRRYIDFLILLIPTPLVSVLFYSSIPTFCSLKKFFFHSLVYSINKRWRLYIRWLEEKYIKGGIYSRYYKYYLQNIIHNRNHHINTGIYIVYGTHIHT